VTGAGSGVIRLYMTMSLDGYVAGPQDSVDAPMGVGGFRLFNWLDRRNDPGPNRQVYNELVATRAVVAGRRTYDHAAGGRATTTTGYRSSS
jgi:dihydrofolate reductase